jgi:hypothetical protein
MLCGGAEQPPRFFSKANNLLLLLLRHQTGSSCLLRVLSKNQRPPPLPRAFPPQSKPFSAPCSFFACCPETSSSSRLGGWLIEYDDLDKMIKSRGKGGSERENFMSTHPSAGLSLAQTPASVSESLRRALRSAASTRTARPRRPTTLHAGSPHPRLPSHSCLRHLPPLPARRGPAHGHWSLGVRA